MIQITRRFLKEKTTRTYNIYTLAEAQELGLKVVPWREAQEGDWALSDDGYCGECLKRLDNGKNRPMVKLSFAYPFTAVKELNFMDFYRTRAWHSSYPRSWKEEELRSRRFKRMTTAWVHKMMEKIASGQPPLLSWQEEKDIGLAYRENETLPVRTFRSLFKVQELRSAMENELSKALAEKGLTKDYAVEFFKDHCEKVKNDPNVRANDRLETAKTLMEFTGLAAKETVKETVVATDYSQFLDGTERKRSIEAKREREIPMQLLGEGAEEVEIDG